MLVKKELLYKHDLFNETFEISEDYDLWLKILIDEEIGFIEDNLIIKYAGHNQLSTKFHSMDYWRLKSLVNILQSREISHIKENLLLDQIHKKSMQLIQGYIKYLNHEKVLEIENILSSLDRRPALDS